MAKIHNNAEKFPIQWDGDVTQVGKDQRNDNIPARVDVTWNAGRPITPYVACWDDGNGGVDGSQCTADVDSYFFEDFDINQDGTISVSDVVFAINVGAPEDYKQRIIDIFVPGNGVNPPSNGPTSLGTATETEFTWGDVNFIQEIMDGIGTGSRRARQDRLNKLDDDKKKRLIRLICRVRGEKVYDDVTEVQDVNVSVDDVEMVVESIVKKVKLEIKENV
mgnify:CR=1 FL=1